MHVKPVRHLRNGKVQLTQRGEDLLEVQVGALVDDAFVRQLQQALRLFESPDTYRHRPHSYQEAARFLDVSTKYLQRRVAKNLIPHRVVGAYVRFTGEDIDEIRASLRCGPCGAWQETERDRQDHNCPLKDHVRAATDWARGRASARPPSPAPGARLDE
jgi:hypothetical protein